MAGELYRQRILKGKEKFSLVFITSENAVRTVVINQSS
jgi:hypothetical protein